MAQALLCLFRPTPVPGFGTVLRLPSLVVAFPIPIHFNPSTPTPHLQPRLLVVFCLLVGVGSALDDCDDIFIGELVGQADTLGLMLDGLSVNDCSAEVIDDGFVNGVTLGRMLVWCAG